MCPQFDAHLKTTRKQSEINQNENITATLGGDPIQIT